MNIKLLITDLDGTFLNDKKEINPEFWDIYKILKNRGIIFVVATGRQLSTITGLFSAIKNEIIFIAENGAIVMKKGKIIHTNALEKHNVHKFINLARSIDSVNTVLCGKSNAYIESDHEEFIEETKIYYHHLKTVEDLTKVNDTILKIALNDKKGADTNSFLALKEYENNHRIAVSGSDWTDITTYTATKGNAVSMIKRMFNISAEETMVFGDYLNDYEMMQEGNHSFAMKNAHPEIKKVSKHITEYDNNNNGVIKTIKEFLLG